MMNGGRNNGRMTPRERYFAEQRAAAEREARARDEAARQAAAREREAKLREQRRIYAEKERRRREAEKRRRQKRAQVAFRRFVTFAAFFAVFLAIAAIFVLISFMTTKVPSSDSTDEAAYTFSYVADGEETISYKSSPSDSVKNGSIYVNFSKLSDWLGFTLTGSGDERRFIAPSGEEVVLTVGSSVMKINENSYRLNGTPEYSDNGEVLLPLTFAEECISGINVSVDNEKHTVTLEKTGKIGFIFKESTTLTPVGGEADVTDPGSSDTDEVPTVEFKAELSEYELYMNPESADEYLLLVNREHKLNESYAPDDLVEVVNTRKDGRNTQKLRLYAAKALEALYVELFENGYDSVGPSGYPVSVTSAYRSYSYQNQLFNQYVDKEMKNNSSLSRADAEAIVMTYSQIPGSSEHQSGLCADMHNLSSAKRDFANEDVYEWLYENAWKFGFILRYPADKTDVTGISFEPWHYRYVGREHAYKMKALGMCLEEYVEYLGE